MFLRVTMSLLAMIALGGCLGGAGALAPCDPSSTDTSICHLTNPEDLGVLADRSWIIVSEMALDGGGTDDEATDGVEGEGHGDGRGEGDIDRHSGAGRLSAIRLRDLEPIPVYPIEVTGRMDAVMQRESVGELEATQRSVSGWGDEHCPGEPDAAIFRPHGLDVGRGPGGKLAVAVVNHGGREAVELFEVEAGEVPSLVWRGCVPMPQGINTNDVAFMPGGGFVVTNFMPAFEGTGPKAIWTMLKINYGLRTGSVLEWTPGGALEEIENSQGSAPNGIAVSPDGQEIYVSEWGGERIYRLRLREGTPPLRDEVELGHHPDNLTWMSDGRLLVAGQLGGVSAALSCASVEHAGCDIGYSVYVIDPGRRDATGPLEATRLFEGRGAGSVALEVDRVDRVDRAGRADGEDREIFVGFFAGDRIERVRPPASNSAP